MMAAGDKTNNIQFLWITLFGISMAFFESSIVVYLRALYYPEGFSFPLEIVDPQIGVTEFLRELFSLIMIISVALIATKNFMQRFSNFLYIFAVWDIFYYIFLKLLLGWPASLMTWDILFLVPVPWTGPVLTPVLISLIMIMFALTIRYFNRLSGFRMFLEIREWLVLLAGALVVFVSFISDFVDYVFGHYTSRAESIEPLFGNLESITLSYTPQEFNWWIYTLGVLLLLFSLSMIYKRNKKLYIKD
ncbi:MAG: hypothetical protein V5A51_02065 [Bacteroidales bacterium]|nr:hypothetical protein [Bacteroidales bacterium]